MSKAEETGRTPEKAFYLTENETKELGSWNRTVIGYHPKGKSRRYNENKAPAFTVNDALYIFSLDPVPPKPGNINDFIDACVRDRDLSQFYFFLHYYEPILNKRIKSELHNEGIYNASAEDYLDIKMIYHDYLLKKLLTYNPDAGVQFTSYIEKGKRDPILAGFCLREDWSASSISEYKTDRRTVCSSDDAEDEFRKAVADYQEKHHCSFEKAYFIVKRPRMKRRRVGLSEYDSEDDYNYSDEYEFAGNPADTSHDYNVDYCGIIHRKTSDAAIDGILDKMDEDTVEIMMRLNGICPVCTDVKTLSESDCLEDIAVDFCCSKEKISDIYHAGIEKLKTELIKKKIIEGAYIRRTGSDEGLPVYSYRIYGVKSDASEGRIRFEPKNGKGEIISLSAGDDGRFADGIISYLSRLKPSSLPKKFLVPIHPEES